MLNLAKCRLKNTGVKPNSLSPTGSGSDRAPRMMGIGMQCFYFVFSQTYFLLLKCVLAIIKIVLYPVETFARRRRVFCVCFLVYFHSVFFKIYEICIHFLKIQSGEPKILFTNLNKLKSF